MGGWQMAGGVRVDAMLDVGRGSSEVQFGFVGLPG